MRRVHFGKGAVLACVCVMVAASAPRASAQSGATLNSKLTGCVSHDLTTGHYLLTPSSSSNKDAATSAIDAASDALGGPSIPGIPGASGLPGITSEHAQASTMYRLSGFDMTAYSNRRVEVTGVIVPSASNPASSIPGATGTTGAFTNAAAAREMRVLQVKPLSGSCPQG